MYVFIHFFGCSVQHVGSQFPNQGLNSSSLRWKHKVLTTGLPGNSLYLFMYFFNTNGFFLSIYTHRHVHACMCVHMSVHCFESYFIWMYFYISTYIFTSVFKIVVWCDCIILHLTLQFHLKSVFLKEFFDEYICMLILLSFCGCSHKKKCLTVELLNQEQVQFKFCFPKSLHKSTAQPACRNLPVSLS